MSIKVGDRVRDLDGDEGDVLALHEGNAWFWWCNSHGVRGYSFLPVSELTPIDAPAPKLLTGAQVAQVLEAWAHAYDTWRPLSGTRRVSLEQHVRNRAQAERERDQ